MQSDSSLCLNEFEIITKDISSQQELKPRHVRTFDFGLEDVLNKNQLQGNGVLKEKKRLRSFDAQKNADEI